MAFKCMGLVVAPGGFGTCDELFELLTLMQTGKIKRQLPIVLIGKKFWKDCIQWDAFVHYGMISDWDAQQLRFADTAEEAMQHLIEGIEALEQAERRRRRRTSSEQCSRLLGTVSKNPAHNLRPLAEFLSAVDSLVSASF